MPDRGHLTKWRSTIAAGRESRWASSRSAAKLLWSIRSPRPACSSAWFASCAYASRICSSHACGTWRSPAAIRTGRRELVPEYGPSELFQETALRRKDCWPRGVKNQHPLGRGVVQCGPGGLDLFQLPQAVLSESIYNYLVSSPRRVRSELNVIMRSFITG